MNSFRITVLSTLTAGLVSTASAITIGQGVIGGSGDVDNVLFNQGVLDAGMTVMGTFNTNPTFTIKFTSTQALEVNGGQATLSGAGSANFNNLSFALTNGDTFTKAQMNPDATSDGTIVFNVSYITPNGNTGNLVFSLTGTGQNYYTILADGTEKITAVTFATPDTWFADSGQFRIGGLEHASTNVPDAGATFGLMGLAMVALAAVRRIVRR